MNKQGLIDAVAEKTGLTKKDVGLALDGITGAITDAFANGEEKVSLVGFGNFVLRERAARVGRNPQSGEEIEIAASKSVGFKAGKQLKESVN